MRPYRPVITTCGLALAASLAACGSSASPTASAPSASSSTASSSPSAPASVSQRSRAGDVAFAQAMIPHHEQAVEMADLALKNGAGPDVTRLATQVKTAQAPEISTMQGWLTAWGASDDMGMDHAGMGHMPGMMSADDMTALAAAKGAALDDLWLRMMVAHHEGALTMANDVLSTTQDPQVLALAEAVVAGQTAEIATMKGLLDR